MRQNINHGVSNSCDIINGHDEYLSFLLIFAYICGMAKTTVQDILELKNQVIQASLDLAADKRWGDIIMADIARHADRPLDDVLSMFNDKTDILAAYARQVDMRLCSAYGAMTCESQRDALFDVIMERFDILNQHRAGVISIINTVTLDPKQVLFALSPLCRSMKTVADLAGIQTDGLKGMAVLTGLGAVYMKSLRDWTGDDTADMARTMAGLDKALGYFEKINAKPSCSPFANTAS